MNDICLFYLFVKTCFDTYPERRMSGGLSVLPDDGGEGFDVIAHPGVIMRAVVADVVFNIIFIFYVTVRVPVAAGCAFFEVAARGAVVAGFGFAFAQVVDVAVCAAVVTGKIFVHVASLLCPVGSGVLFYSLVFVCLVCRPHPSVRGGGHLLKGEGCCFTFSLSFCTVCQPHPTGLPSPKGRGKTGWVRGDCFTFSLFVLFGVSASPFCPSGIFPLLKGEGRTIPVYFCAGYYCVAVA